MRTPLLVTALACASTAAAAEPTKDQALAALGAWVKAQNDGDFAAYTALYGARFVGIKRTKDGGAKKLTLARWKTDRKRMFGAKQKVAAEGENVVIKGDQVVIVFVQRYQSGGYADHGDKVLVLRPGPKGLVIMREEMLYSAPGWEADPKMEVDASALVAPIRATVKQTAGTTGGDCTNVSYTLVLTDAKGKKVVQDIGSGVVVADKPEVAITSSPGAAKLFEFGEWCAGGGDYYEIVKNGDALVVRYKAEDEGAEGPATWETRLTIRLAAGATVK